MKLLLPRTRRLILAVSGGADSMAMLALLSEADLELEVAHLDHRLRPESAEDAAFVQAEAERLGLPFHLARVNVRKLARRKHTSLESAGRLARYRFLRRLARRRQAGAATAHPADDQAETVLMRLAEGGSPTGIWPRVGDWLVRPLLKVRRDELRRLLTERGLSWREDPTNLSNLPRSRVRHSVLPAMESLNPMAVEALGRVAERARRDERWLRWLARGQLSRWGEPRPGGLALPEAWLKGLAEPLRTRVLRCVLSQVAPGARLTARHHRGEALPGGVLRYREGEMLVFQGRLAPLPEVVLQAGRNELTEWGLVLEICQVAELETGPEVICLDLDRLGQPWLLRPRRRGDAMAPYRGRVEPSATASTRVKEVLQKAGVPRSQRETVPVVECGGEIVWLAGVRADRRFLATPASQRILRFRLLRQGTAAWGGRLDTALSP